MGIRSIAKRTQYGSRLIRLELQGTQAIEQLQELTTSLPTLRSDINADEDLTAQEKSEAVAEVNAVITELITKVKEFADGL